MLTVVLPACEGYTGPVILDLTVLSVLLNVATER